MADIAKYLFVDIFLVLPVAIFSTCPRIVIIAFLTFSSGMDGAISNTIQKATNGEFGFKEGTHSFAGPDRPFACDSDNCFHCCEATVLVCLRRTSLLFLANSFTGSYRLS